MYFSKYSYICDGAVSTKRRHAVKRIYFPKQFVISLCKRNYFLGACKNRRDTAVAVRHHTLQFVAVRATLTHTSYTHMLLWGAKIKSVCSIPAVEVGRCRIRRTNCKRTPVTRREREQLIERQTKRHQYSSITQHTQHSG